MIWRHYKGGDYIVLHSEALLTTGDVVVTVYASCQDGRIYVRPWAEWIETVTWPDGKERARFVPAKPLDGVMARKLPP